MSLKLTDEQRAAIKESRQGGPMAINAVAGSGKTLTLAGIAYADPTPGVYLVFNEAMKRDAQGRFPEHMHPMTGHSLGFRGVITKSWGYQSKFRAAQNGRHIALGRITEVIDCMELSPLTQRQAAAFVLDTVKQYQYSADFEMGPHHVPIEKIPAKIRAYSDKATLEYFREVAYENALKVWERMADEDDEFPILHDTYLKLFQLRAPQIGAPRWLCDEFQDANPVIDALIRQQEGQKIYVGDRHQAIYGWRKAVNALNELTLRPEVRSHTLSQSFRFGGEIAGLANRILGALGETTRIKGVGQPLCRPDPTKPKVVIARNNLTLLDHVLSASEKGKRFCLIGNAGEVASMIRSAYALYCGDTAGVKHKEMKGYESWKDFKDTAKLLDDQVLGRLVSIMEMYKSHSLNLADQILAHKDTQEHEATVVLVTTHKAKGREWDQVELADDLALSPKLIAKMQNGIALSETETESVNILYVALTRARHSLVLPGNIRDNLMALKPTKNEVLASDVMSEAMEGEETQMSTPTCN